MELDLQERRLSHHLKSQALILGGFLLAFWLLEIADQFIFHHALDGLGVRPRTVAGLRGILFAPFLHGSFPHLIANTIPFLVLGWFVLLQGGRQFWLVTFTTMVVSGLGMWLFGRANSIHLGASGLIFGYFGFLLLRAYFERSARAFLWAVVVFLLYGGMLWGLVSFQAGISWQAHLFGFVGGGVAAYLLGQQPRPLSDQIVIYE
ncbi:MAG: rhomboid family intramembrane serine protease [Anaerolineales bacterium]|nr:rhomboid family intramembrane serine protease [Anaerolineales bacterium]